MLIKTRILLGALLLELGGFGVLLWDNWNYSKQVLYAEKLLNYKAVITDAGSHLEVSADRLERQVQLLATAASTTPLIHRPRLLESSLQLTPEALSIGLWQVGNDLQQLDRDAKIHLAPTQTELEQIFSRTEKRPIWLAPRAPDTHPEMRIITLAFGDTYQDQKMASYINWDISGVARQLSEVYLSERSFTFLVDERYRQLLSYDPLEGFLSTPINALPYLNESFFTAPIGAIQVIEQLYINDQPYLVLFIRSRIGLSFGAVVPITDINAPIAKIAMQGLNTGVILAALAALLTLFILAWNFKPFDKVLASLREAIKEDPVYGIQVTPISYSPSNEFGPVIKSVNSVFERLNCTIRELGESSRSLEELNRTLEEKVARRTDELARRKTELEDSLQQLKAAQAELIQSEKMASLGGLVAGVAHEINTPLGITVTAISHLDTQVADISQRFADKRLTAQDFATFLEGARESVDIITTNTHRAADLVRSFKLVAVDQSSDERRPFALHEYVQEVMRSLAPKLKRSRHRIEIDIPRDLVINSYPGAFAQMLTIMVMNSLTHGYDEDQVGCLHIAARREGENITFSYQDDGRGMAEEHLKRIFEPFFTTKRGAGGSGLGAHILFNLVSQVLKGRIEAHSNPGQGLGFDIRFSDN